MKSSLMSLRRPPESESTERNAPSVEAAFQAAPAEMVAEILDGELHLSPRPARPHANVASNLGIILGAPFKFGRGGPGGWVIIEIRQGEESYEGSNQHSIETQSYGPYEVSFAFVG